MPADDAEPGFDPELDLLRRYEAMVQTQVETLNGIDDKASSVARLVGVLSGLLLSAVSISVGVEGVSLTSETGTAFVALGVAILAFFVSLLFAIITYLSSKFTYGPTADLGDYMAGYRVDSGTYREMLLRGYSEAIRDNRRVVVNNARRFERCLASLLVGVLYLFAAGTVLVSTWNFAVEAGLFLGFSVLAVRLAAYILREEYLTLERAVAYDE